MAIDWDELVLSSTMGIFGEGDALVPAALPIYTPRGGVPFALADAVFDENYADATLDGEGTENSARKPCLGVRLARFREAGAPDPGQDDMVFIPRVNGTYIVKEPRPDGHGEARLILMGPVQP